MNTALDAYRARATEAEIQSAITGLVEWRGGVWSHIRDSRGMHAEGQPDLLIVLPPTVYLLELKRITGKPSPMQVRWLSLLEWCDRLVTGVVRPLPVGDDYSLDEVLEMLRAGGEGSPLFDTTVVEANGRQDKEQTLPLFAALEGIE